MAMLRKYGRTIENNTHPFSVYLLARLGACFVLRTFTDVTTFLLLSIASISMYLNVSPKGEVAFIGLNMSNPLAQTQL